MLGVFPHFWKIPLKCNLYCLCTSRCLVHACMYVCLYIGMNGCMYVRGRACIHVAVGVRVRVLCFSGMHNILLTADTGRRHCRARERWQADVAEEVIVFDFEQKKGFLHVCTTWASYDAILHLEFLLLYCALLFDMGYVTV